MALQDQFFPDNRNRNVQSFMMGNNGYELVQIPQVPIRNLVVSPAVAFQLERQRQEIDQLIFNQKEILKSEINRQSSENMMIILREYEAKAIFMTNQKDEEIGKAKRKETELQDSLRKMAMENEAWRITALQKEAMAVSLNNSIAELKQSNINSCDIGIVVGDSESRCDEEDDDDDGSINGMICRGCGLSSSCVVFLPCRHLCSCQSCDPLMSSCPVCKMVKKSTLLALL